MTANLREILAWANQGQQLFDVPAVDIMEAAAAWQRQQQPDAGEEAGGRSVTKIAAEALRPGIAGEIVDGRLAMPERRRLVLAKAKETGNRSGGQIAAMLFELSGLSSKDRSNLVRTITDDLQHHRKMGALEDQPSSGTSPNGPFAEKLI